MTTLSNAAPKFIFGGINDKSRGTMVRGEETYPQHMPLLRLFTETGPTETTLVNNASGSFNSIFGARTLDRRDKFHNLQSLLAETMLAEGNSFFVKRLKPEDAPKPSRIIIGIDMVDDKIPKRTRDLGGFYYPGTDADDIEYDSNGNPVMVDGVRAKIVMIHDNETEVGQQDLIDGSFLSTDTGAQSQIVPLLEMPVSFFGKAGDMSGFRMWAPTTNDNIPFDEKTTDEFKTRMYRAQFMRRDSNSASPVVVPTAAGENYVDMCFTPGAYSASTDKEYYIEETLVQSYEDDGISSGQPPLYSPFSEVHVYQSNLEAVQSHLYNKEMAVNPAAATTMTDPGQFDVFTGIDVDGDPYHGLLLEGPIKGGVFLGKDTTVYASGGGDGTTDLDEYEKLVNRENLNFGQLGDEYDNVAVYPFSVIYDTGLSMDSKYQMMNVLGARHDLRCIFTTYVEKEQRMPTKSEEVSRAQALMARLRAYPESTLYSTPVCRAEIIQQTGRLATGGYTKPVPQVIDYAQRWARMAGAGTGIMREGQDIDVSPNNHVELIKSPNVKFFNERTQSNIWDSGATYTLSYDRRRQYYPALRSVYADETSVLLSPITVAICCDVIRLIRLVHANLSGNAKLTRPQFIERSDNLVLELTEGRYNERVVIEPETYFSEDDDRRGFSWHCKVKVYANNPKTVMFFDLETYRMEDLPA